MATITAGLAPLRGCARSSATQWQQALQQRFQALRIAPGSYTTTRTESTFAEPTGRSQNGFEKAFGNGFVEEEFEDAAATLAHARPLPISPSYFTRQEQFTDAYVRVQDLFRRYQHLPAAPPDKVPRVAWSKLADYKRVLGEPVKAADYAHCMEMVKHLNKIHPDLVPAQVTEALKPFRRQLNPFVNEPNPIPIDRFGRALGVGRRKTSVARAWLVEGTGEVIVNGKPLCDAFHRVHDRESATWALRATDRVDKYNVWALVGGGGTTGQAEAMTLAVSKALMAHEPALKPALRRAGCVTRDPRMVERKKPGHVKARKSPTWVKR